MSNGSDNESVSRPAAMMMLKYASDFYASAKPAQQPPPYSPKPYYDCCHAIELALKAFLLAKGQTEQFLRRLGHDLVAALDEAERQGLSDHVQLTPEESQELQKANKYYMRKGFEYFTLKAMVMSLEGRADMGDLEVLKQSCERLTVGLDEVCRDALNDPSAGGSGIGLPNVRFS